MPSGELERMLLCLADFQPGDDAQGKRLTSIQLSDISTAYFYNLLIFRGVSWQYTSYVWNALISLKHMVFLWLAFKGHLNTRDNMVRKNGMLISGTGL